MVRPNFEVQSVRLRIQRARTLELLAGPINGGNLSLNEYGPAEGLEFALDDSEHLIPLTGLGFRS